MSTQFTKIKTGHANGYASFNSQLYSLVLHLDNGHRQVPLGYSGSRVLARLLSQPGEVVSREDLIQHGWSDRVVGPGSLNQQIYTLRQLLGDEKQRQIIQTLPRRGYLLNPSALSHIEDAHKEAPGPIQPSLLNRLWTRLRTTQQAS